MNPKSVSFRSPLVSFCSVAHLAAVFMAGLMLGESASGQSLATLYSFLAPEDHTADPAAGLIISGTSLYGTSALGGSYGSGTIFTLNTNGTGFTILYNFSGGSDGANPVGDLALSGSTLYGTASGGVKVFL
jgi:uncharacterized repeat protein (TIGR03803 family)